MQEELRQDLIEVRKIISDQEICDIAMNALKEALKITLQTKIKDILNFVKLIVVNSIKLTKYLYRTIKQEGWNSPKIWWQDVKTSVMKTVEQVKVIWKQMSPQQKVDTLIDFVIIIFMTFIVSGGFDFEGGLPDTDLAFGVGAHRDIFTHTILIGLTVEFTIRFLVALITESEKREYTPKSKFLQAILNFAKKHHNTVISGMWLGLFLHFLKDANLLSNRTKPYAGINGLSMKQHKSIFASNAFASAVFSQQSMER